jgi:hypothetical protein
MVVAWTPTGLCCRRRLVGSVEGVLGDRSCRLSTYLSRPAATMQLLRYLTGLCSRRRLAGDVVELVELVEYLAS